ncbi:MULTISPECIES: amino acid permease [Acinetobacter]|uniref:Aromatic amino acid transport protein AroP n=1 Tax=Acinetobacter venetianus TaxID=52133 RepID=A0A150HSS6_9GAMM|nr:MULTISPECIES: amino acid permease [Acinetobacter]MDA0697424.1 amino acid permease [Pseudomonadota bacterium]KXO82882.1 D-alanine/D-serine/glycine permease [Acinetobacter venetianus]KXO85929.1 D-alanine/D-serine/glycine permease [Acinetobacter venetianus]KXZ69663.1 Aromatic amino acid transport protein AroP [Acinetobacter venetianus]KXZ73041.1 Aromatic amino acid transport protein AroP [Acinetobacter venetianus]
MNNDSSKLQRGLKNRHIQLIAMGGAIGTGLFLGSAQVIQSAGPSIILGYAIGGLIAFLIMRQLGEMIVEEPVAGSFSHFAYQYWGKFPGFLSGWNYWVLYILVAMSELTAVAKYINYWWPHIAAWQSVLFFFVIITAINLTNVKFYGESEFWLAIIKVTAVVAMILFGLYLLFTADANSTASFSNLWSHGGFFPNGFDGLFYMLAFLMFAFGGIELIGMAAAEANDPKKTIPKAINQVVVRILIFYVGSLAILLSLVPWNQLDLGGLDKSPFVMIFSQMGIGWAAHLLNFIILTAALSVYNSGMYANSRMLFGLAEQGNAPKVFAKVNKQGVPVPAVLLSALLIFGCVLLNYFVPEDALGHLMYIVVGALVLNWAMISLTHLKFKAMTKEKGLKTSFPALWSPLSNYLVLAFIAVVLYIMWQQGFKESVLMIPIWIVLMFILFNVLNKKKTD